MDVNEYIYAILNSDNYVTNIVTADNSNSVTPLKLLIPEAADIILTTEETLPAYIGGDIYNGKFRPPKPFNSWLWDDESWSWIPPTPYPNDGILYIWNEDIQNWETPSEE